MTGFLQLLAHLWGDYIFQSDWMAQNKTKRFLPAFAHAVTYSLLFLLFRPSLAAWLVIVGTHFFIDRYRLARYVVWAKNWLAPWPQMAKMSLTSAGKTEELWTERGAITMTDDRYFDWRRRGTLPWSECSATGYPPTTPTWLSVWLLIIADNILHLTINAAALAWL